MGKRKSDETKEEREERKRLKKEKKKRKKEERKEEKKHKRRRESKEENSNSRTTDRDQLSTAENSSSEVFLHKKVELTVSLLPAALGNVLGGIKDALRLFLLKYSAGFSGVMLAFDNVKILSDSDKGAVGMIFDELPYIHYRVSVEVLVFCPVPNCKLSGVVMESFHSHLSLVVYHYFNASVSAEDMRAAGFEFDEEQLQWFLVNGSKALSKDDGIEFVCKKIYESGGIISIDGNKPKVKVKM